MKTKPSDDRNDDGSNGAIRGGRWMRWSAAVLLACAGCLAPESEQCPDGTWCQPDWTCSVAFGPKTVCVPDDGCGNGRIDRGEVCDDGNIIPGDGCSADCKKLEHCGNGVIDPGEVCDDGNTRSGDGCNATCTVRESCGNGYLDPGERCDDGNTMSGDGCNESCDSIEVCGNGITDVGEECDSGDADRDGVPDSTATCDSDCTLPVCGDGLFNAGAGEQCDTGGDSLACDSDCTLPACGDDHANASAGEDCDSGGVDTEDCDRDCTFPACGDGGPSLPPRTPRPTASGGEATFSTPVTTSYEWSTTEPRIPAEGAL